MNAAKIQLLTVLNDAVSQDYALVKRAEDILKQWEIEPNFFITLQEIFYDKTISHDVRALAGIYLKNGVDRFWRKAATRPIDVEEKRIIRLKLLQFMDEPSKRLTSQNSVIIARVARLDYPQEWPDLFSGLVQIITNADDIFVHDRCLETMFEVLSELSTRLLSSSKKQFSDLAPDVFQVVLYIYKKYTDLVFMTEINQCFVELDIVMTCIKCIRILLVSGVKNIHKYQETVTFIELSTSNLNRIITTRNTMFKRNNDLISLQYLDNVIEEYGNLYLSLQKTHPISVVLCPSWLNTINYYWKIIINEGRKSTNNSCDQLSLQGLLLIKETIKSSSYNSISLDLLSVTEEEKQLVLDSAKILNEQFVTSEFVNVCAEILVTNYMLLTSDDLEKWEEDPEGWVNSTDSENWEFEIRPCAEVTFMTLLSKKRESLVPIIISLVDRLSEVADFQTLLYKDAVYAAIGLGVNSLYGRFDFEPFVINRLQSEIKQKDMSFKVIRRRIAWLLGKWVTESMSSNCRKIVYEILLDLMIENEDLVVRLTAVQALKNAMEDWDFDIEIILPYLGAAVCLLLNILGKVEDPDIMKKLISCLSAIIDRAGPKVSPYTEIVIQHLSSLWNPQTEPLLQSSLVIIYTKLVGVLDTESMKLHGFLIPVVKHCIDINNGIHVYLLEDSLDLWWVILQCTPISTPDVMSLFPALLELLDHDTENLRKLLKIVDSYIMLDPPSVLLFSSTLFTKLSEKVCQSREQAAAYIVHTLDLAFQSASLDIYSDALIQSKLINNIVSLLLNGKMYGYAVMNYMNLLSRLSMYDSSFVLRTIQSMNPQQPEQFLSCVLDTWFDKFDSLCQTRARKLACIGFTQLLLTGNQVTVNKLSNIVAIWTDVGLEIKETEQEHEVDMEGDVYEIEKSTEKERRHAISHHDLVYTTDLVKLIGDSVRQPFILPLFEQFDPVLLKQVYDLIQ